jgi:rhodanese-related sulfurtransferase
MKTTIRSTKLFNGVAGGLLAGVVVLAPLAGQAQQQATKAKEWYVASGKWTKSTESQPIPSTVTAITADQLKAMLDQKQKFLLVDSRNGAEYREGHIPRAIHVYDKEMEAHKAKFPSDKGFPLVFYCNGYPECPRSVNGAKIAIEWGYTKILLFKGGIPEWVAKGYPLER